MHLLRIRTTLTAIGLAAVVAVVTSACDDVRDNTTRPARATVEERSHVPNMASSDAGITAQLQLRLQGEHTIDADGISVSTQNGIVTLEGFVAGASTRSAAERVAKSVPGVIRVNNLLVITSGGLTTLQQ